MNPITTQESALSDAIMIHAGEEGTLTGWHLDLEVSGNLGCVWWVTQGRPVLTGPRPGPRPLGSVCSTMRHTCQWPEPVPPYPSQSPQHLPHLMRWLRSWIWQKFLPLIYCSEPPNKVSQGDKRLVIQDHGQCPTNGSDCFLFIPMCRFLPQSPYSTFSRGGGYGTPCHLPMFFTMNAVRNQNERREAEAIHLLLHSDTTWHMLKDQQLLMMMNDYLCPDAM